MISSLYKLIDADLRKDGHAEPSVRLFRFTSLGFIPALVTITASVASDERLPPILVAGAALLTVGWVMIVGWRSWRVPHTNRGRAHKTTDDATMQTSLTLGTPLFGRSRLSDKELAEIWEEAERSNPKSFRVFYEFEQYEDDGPRLDYMQCYLMMHRPEMDSQREGEVYIDLTDYRARMLLKALIERGSFGDVRDYGLARNSLTTHFGRDLTEVERKALVRWICQFESEHMGDVTRAGWQPYRGDH